MINYNKNLFAILIIYLMRTAGLNCQFQTFTRTTSMRPIWKFSSFVQNEVQYQCYQKCIPVDQSQPQMLVDLCNKVCPSNPTMPDCIKCPKILSQTVPIMTIDEITKRLDMAEPEIIVIEPQSHAIFFRPEVLVMGQERKQCCYMDQCETVPLHAKCESRCYEPCDAVCTGRCRLNPQCPNQCEVVKHKLYKMQYKMWLSTKLNEIKMRYRALATECLLKTRLAFVQEVHSVQSQTPAFLGHELSVQVVQHPVGPNQVLAQLQDEDEEDVSNGKTAEMNYEGDELQNNGRLDDSNYNDDDYNDKNNHFSDFTKK